ncbi:hypothetical protein [Methylocystis bryophila]|uniref:Uncharacterized protein n=1 Tax=Methylocystis bryophila TaxID=655015 RepID=A0A1W6MUW9_9HYPH|nr:hypothetical protein [Methylocystis bryophila]ARN81382.1 hypothetical protein B1812_10160 [Methylocystis bryophila]BDV37369.1 hypothetical protein DSM21852_06220 [Methylocystis bryophila]
MTIAAPDPQVRQRLPRVTAFRNVRWCALWAVLVAVSCALVLNPNVYLQFPALLLFLYATQAFIAEYMGVRISVDWVSAPRRLPGLWAPRQTPWIWPIAVFWRTYGSPSEIEGLTSLSAEGPGVVELQWMRGGRIWLLLSGRDSKLAFFESLRRYRPQVRIFREVRKFHDYRENRPDLA